jgi:hypothetical protein
MARKFPKTLFVKVADGGSGPDYFEAGEDTVGMVETGVKTKIAVYRLEGEVMCEGVIKTTPIKRR